MGAGFRSCSLEHVLSSCGTSLAAPQHVESLIPQTRDQTHVSCTGTRLSTTGPQRKSPVFFWSRITLICELQAN